MFEYGTRNQDHSEEILLHVSEYLGHANIGTTFDVYTAYMEAESRIRKELAVVLGHSSGIFTMQHYVVPSQKVCEEVLEFEEIFLNAMPVKLEDDEILLKETLIFEVPGYNEYSENLIKSSTIEVRKNDFGKESIAETMEIPYNNAV